MSSSFVEVLKMEMVVMWLGTMALIGAGARMIIRRQRLPEYVDGAREWRVLVHEPSVRDDEADASSPDRQVLAR